MPLKLIHCIAIQGNIVSGSEWRITPTAIDQTFESLAADPAYDDCDLIRFDTLVGASLDPKRITTIINERAWSDEFKPLRQRLALMPDEPAVNPNKLTEQERDVIDGLRSRGFAVVVFNPDELREADRETVEDVGVDRMWGAINDMNEQAEEETP